MPRNAPRAGAWIPSDPASWSEYLGLVQLPLFPPHATDGATTGYEVMLDGSSSFVVKSISGDERADAIFDDRLLSWAWSANFRHCVLLDKTAGLALVRRWDDPSQIRRFHLPTSPAVAEKFLVALREVPPPRGLDVVSFAMAIFRQLRESLLLREVDTLRLFNLMLLGVEKAAGDLQSKDKLLSASTVGDLLKVFDDEELDLADCVSLDQSAASKPLGVLVDRFFEGEPFTQSKFFPSLLLRHASGLLYQEAHLEVERGSGQLSLAGMAPEGEPTGSLRRDVRYTPTELARAMAEQAIARRLALGTPPGVLKVLDPACGSGIFLQEVVRDLQLRGYRGRLHLIGYDVSPVAQAVCRFVLRRAARDASSAGMEVLIDVGGGDSLAKNWDTVDIILMNPPFVPWRRLSEAERSVVAAILGGLVTGHSDLALAFLWKAVDSLDAGGVVGAVLPAPLLESYSALALRERVAELCSVDLIGRFQTYTYFGGSMVEPAFVMVTRGGSAAGPVRTLLARDGGEEAALRALRLPDELIGRTEAGDQWELRTIASDSLAPESWTPQPQELAAAAEKLKERSFPTVGQLFDVRQGVITGANEVFLIGAEDYFALPGAERKFFREAILNGSIVDGHLEASRFIFYPYKSGRLLIESEEALRLAVPTYCRRHLEPNLSLLTARQRVGASGWWKLTEYRRWQSDFPAKLVSTYFGLSGNFGLDSQGKMVVVQGYAWLWRDSDWSPVGSGGGVGFYDTPLPWAYLAVLNSPEFERMVGMWAPRVGGGQFNLSRRFIARAYLPDLRETHGELVTELAGLGRAMAGRKEWDKVRLSRLSSLLYGL